ncbi:MAG: biotin--[acetyl-CoA-carboxylase] ligase [Lachnospiraceae bacterium]|nr:biotin--[acetyl-CoA-carboxylase] ligase [Lachnospiraceae bacterium]
MLKDDVLKELFREDAPVSGEEIASALGVSRAAIHKAVSALREEGYVIEAATRKGYRLISRPDALSRAEILRHLDPEGSRFSLHVFRTIDSTNNWLKAHFQELGDFTAAVSDHQSGGRGRMGRSFVSPPGKGVYLSVLLKPAAPLSDFRCITAMAAVAASDAIEKTAGVRPGIKWPNDLVMNGKKVAGILTEMSLEGETGALQYIVLGIGINVLERPEDFPEEIRTIAGSIASQGGRPGKRAELAAALLNAFARILGDLPAHQKSSHAQYVQDCLNLGKQVIVVKDGSERSALTLSVDDDFGLVVRYADGTEETVRTGEVSVRGLYGYV